MKEIPANVSDSTRKRNPHLYGVLVKGALVEVKKGRRIAQSDKPLLNKLETEWFNIIKNQFPNFPRPRAQSKRYRIANGLHYTPDITASSWPQAIGPAMETAWEIKGKHAWDDSIAKLKVAAHEWPEVRWVLAWKEDDRWQTQEVLS